MTQKPPITNPHEALLWNYLLGHDPKPFLKLARQKFNLWRRLLSPSFKNWYYKRIKDIKALPK